MLKNKEKFIVRTSAYEENVIRYECVVGVGLYHFYRMHVV